MTRAGIEGQQPYAPSQRQSPPARVFVSIPCLFNQVSGGWIFAPREPPPLRQREIFKRAGPAIINHGRYHFVIKLPIRALYAVACVCVRMQIKLYRVPFGTHTRLVSRPILVYSLQHDEIAVFPINYDNLLGFETT